jgi:hypothetical protein
MVQQKSENQLMDKLGASTRLFQITGANACVKETKAMSRELKVAQQELEALRKERDDLLRESKEREENVFPDAASYTAQLEQEVKRLNENNHQLSVALTAIVEAEGAVADAIQTSMFREDACLIMPRVVYAYDKSDRSKGLADDDASSLTSDGYPNYSVHTCGVACFNPWDCVIT